MARRCGWCGRSGHNRRTCSSLKDYTEKNPDTYTARVESRRKIRNSRTVRKCTYCQESGHNRRSCTLLSRDKAYYGKKQREWRKSILQHMEEQGLAVGALVGTSPARGYVKEGDDLRSAHLADDVCVGYVTDIDWDSIVLRGKSCVKIAWLNRLNWDGAPWVSKSHVFDDSTFAKPDDPVKTNQLFWVLSGVDQKYVNPPKGWVNAGDTGDVFDKPRWQVPGFNRDPND